MRPAGARCDRRFANMDCRSPLPQPEAISSWKALLAASTAWMLPASSARRPDFVQRTCVLERRKGDDRPLVRDGGN